MVETGIGGGRSVKNSNAKGKRGEREARDVWELPSSTGYPRPLPTEFYDQRRWREIHKMADDLIATKNGKVLAALYRSPDEKLREDYVAFVEMLQEWAKSLEADNGA